MPSCLVVDDSRVVRAVARRILEEMQVDVTEAENGQVALDRCNEGVPDAVLLYWNMPVMDGIGFLKALRAAPHEKQPIVVFCTTERDLNNIRVAIEAGADEYIMKPFDQEIVQSKFQEVGIL